MMGGRWRSGSAREPGAMAMRHGLEAGVAILLLTIAGCQPPKAAEAKKPEPPAKVDKVAKEDDLGKVALTAEAEERLGLKTAEVVKKSVGRTRTYAGDVIVPTGRLIVVSAPFIGKLIAPEKGGLPTPGTAVKKGQ